MYEVWSVTGEPLHRSGAAVRLPPIGEFAGSSLRYDRLVIDGRSWRMLAAPASIDSYPVVLRLSQSEERLRGELREILVVLVPDSRWSSVSRQSAGICSHGVP